MFQTLKSRRGSYQVLPRPSRPSRRCQSPTDPFRSSRPTSKKLRFSSVESVISVGDEVPMGNFGRSSVPDAIYDSETDERSDSLLAIWARDQIQGPMFHSRGGESVLRSTLDLIRSL